MHHVHYYNKQSHEFRQLFGGWWIHQDLRALVSERLSAPEPAEPARSPTLLQTDRDPVCALEGPEEAVQNQIYTLFTNYCSWLEARRRDGGVKHMMTDNHPTASGEDRLCHM